MSLAEVIVIMSMSFVVNDIDVPEVEMPPVQQEGSASWYGGGDGDNGMYGQHTATGEPFVPSDRTCASRAIPLNTLVVVENLDTGGITTCRVNDRGPYWAHLPDGTGVAQYWSGGQCVVRHHDGTGWTSREELATCPGEYRDIMDLSRGTAEALDFDFNKGLNQIRVRYHEATDGSSRVAFEN